LSTNTKFELNALLQNAKDAWARTQVVVKRELGEKHTLQWMSLVDRQRLTVLLVWEQKYKVSLEWMVELLLNHYQGKRKRVTSGRHYRNPALPVRVVTLVSETSRELIENAIEAAYPNGENVQMWRTRMRHLLATSAVEVEPSAPFTKFDSLKDYVRSYAESILFYRDVVDGQAARRRQGGKPYRNSPWR
jgi:hypothetical protein